MFFESMTILMRKGVSTITLVIKGDGGPVNPKADRSQDSNSTSVNAIPKKRKNHFVPYLWYPRQNDRYLYNMQDAHVIMFISM